MPMAFYGRFKKRLRGGSINELCSSFRKNFVLCRIHNGCAESFQQDYPCLCRQPWGTAGLDCRSPVGITGLGGRFEYPPGIQGLNRSMASGPLSGAGHHNDAQLLGGCRTDDGNAAANNVQKNLSMLGVALLISHFGSGPLSIDKSEK